jgi:hypothetical protein
LESFAEQLLTLENLKALNKYVIFWGKMFCDLINMFCFCAKCDVSTNAWVGKEKLTWIRQLAIFFEIMSK